MQTLPTLDDKVGASKSGRKRSVCFQLSWAMIVVIGRWRPDDRFRLPLLLLRTLPSLTECSHSSNPIG